MKSHKHVFLGLVNWSITPISWGIGAFLMSYLNSTGLIYPISHFFNIWSHRIYHIDLP